jgi:hypothetical protein
VPERLEVQKGSKLSEVDPLEMGTIASPPFRPGSCAAARGCFVTSLFVFALPVEQDQTRRSIARHLLERLLAEFRLRPLGEVATSTALEPLFAQVFAQAWNPIERPREMLRSLEAH